MVRTVPGSGDDPQTGGRDLVHKGPCLLVLIGPGCLSLPLSSLSDVRLSDAAVRIGQGHQSCQSGQVLTILPDLTVLTALSITLL